jgi:hypothetical protein
MLVVNAVPDAPGWEPIHDMIGLAGRVFDSTVVTLVRRDHAWTSKVACALKSRLRATDGEDCVIVCAGPTDLLAVVGMYSWRRRFRRVHAWVIDSFWTERIPRFLRATRMVDHYWVTTREDVQAWRNATRAPTLWLPWGTDTVVDGLTAHEVRDIDLLRVGRQPPEWDDDGLSARDCLSHGLRFHGRPAAPDRVGSDGASCLARAAVNQSRLRGMYARARFALAFSNDAHVMSYTHPHRPYVTARWVDAIAQGAIVAGIPPSSETADALLWPEGLLDLGTTSRDRGLRILAAHASQWDDERAQRNRVLARGRLDWRHRLKEIADSMGRRYPRLEAELSDLESAPGSVNVAAR